MNELIHSFGTSKELTTAISLTVLIFGRAIFAVFFTPFFGGKLVPARIKIGVGIALSLLLYPALSKALPEPLPTQTALVILLFVKESFIGLSLGLLISMVFYGVQAAGQFIDNERGLSIAAIFNPQMGAQVSLTGQFSFQLALMIFFAINGHQFYIRALCHSFEVLPLVSYPQLNADVIVGPSYVILAKASGQVFMVAVQLAAPIAISMFLAEVVLGVANRVAPQMDVQFISYTLKAMVGLIILFLGLPLLVWQLERLFAGSLQSVQDLIEIFKP